jgi:hypothetical protein
LLLCSKKLRLVLLRLNSLHSDEFQLHHLHLQGLGLNMIGLAGQSGTEGGHVGVNGLLLLQEAIVGTVDCCGHGHSPVASTIHKHILSIVGFFIFLGEDGGLEARGNTRDIESCTWGSGVRNIGSRANTAGAETREQRSAVGISGHLGKYGSG